MAMAKDRAYFNQDITPRLLQLIKSAKTSLIVVSPYVDIVGWTHVQNELLKAKANKADCNPANIRFCINP